MRAINDLKLIGAISAAPTLQNRSGTHVMEGTVTMETVINGRSRTTYVPFVVVGKPARRLFQRVGTGSIVNLSGVARQERWTGTDDQEHERIRFLALRAEVIGGAGTVTNGEYGPHLIGGKNAVTIGGNIVAAPIAKRVKVGDENVLVAEFSIALNETYERNGVRVSRVSYLPVTAWREQAEAALSMGKGQPVMIDGAVFGENYTDKKGQKKSTLRFEAVDIYPVEAPAAVIQMDAPLPVASD